MKTIMCIAWATLLLLPALAGAAPVDLTQVRGQVLGPDVALLLDFRAITEGGNVQLGRGGREGGGWTDDYDIILREQKKSGDPHGSEGPGGNNSGEVPPGGGGGGGGGAGGGAL